MNTQSPSTAHPAVDSSRLLEALEVGRERALEQEAISHLYEGERTQRGIFGQSTPRPLSSDQVLATLEHLDKVSDQIAIVQTWLRTHPELLVVLDESIRKEYRQMEQRTNRMGLLINTFFTLVGAFIGYWLPIVIQWLSTTR